MGGVERGASAGWSEKLLRDERGGICVDRPTYKTSNQPARPVGISFSRRFRCSFRYPFQPASRHVHARGDEASLNPKDASCAAREGLAWALGERGASASGEESERGGGGSLRLIPVDMIHTAIGVLRYVRTYVNNGLES